MTSTFVRISLRHFAQHLLRYPLLPAAFAAIAAVALAAAAGYIPGRAAARLEIHKAIEQE